MKTKLLFVTIALCVFIFFGFTANRNNKVNYGTEFCQGFEDGYCEGYKDVKGAYALCPLTPLCPLPNMGQSNDNYKDGYNTGFKAGMRKGYDRY